MWKQSPFTVQNWKWTQQRSQNWSSAKKFLSAGTRVGWMKSWTSEGAINVGASTMSRLNVQYRRTSALNVVATITKTTVRPNWSAQFVVKQSEFVICPSTHHTLHWAIHVRPTSPKSMLNDATSTMHNSHHLQNWHHIYQRQRHALHTQYHHPHHRHHYRLHHLHRHRHHHRHHRHQ